MKSLKKGDGFVTGIANAVLFLCPTGNGRLDKV